MTTTATLSLTQNGQDNLTGDYTILDNEWGVTTSNLAAVGATVSQVGTVSNYTAQGGVGSVIFTNTYPAVECPTAIWAYSEVYWGGLSGFASPVTTTIGNIKSLTVNYSTAISGTTEQHSDILFDLWTMNSSNHLTNEIAIQVYGWNATSGGIAYSDSHITANLTIGVSGNTATGTPPTMETFRTTTDSLSGTIDFAPILQYLEAKGYVNPNDTISGLELGSEVANGSNTFTVSSFNVFETVSTAKTIVDDVSSSTQVWDPTNNTNYVQNAPNQFFDITTNNNYVINGGQYGSTDTVRVNSSAFGFAFTTSSDGHLHLAESGFGNIDITNVGSIQFSDGNLAISGSSLTLSASSSTVAANLAALEAINTSSGDHVAVTLTDAASIPTIKLTAGQFSADTAALKAIGGTFNTEIVAPTTSTTINGGVSGLGMIVDFADKASNYAITANADHSLTVTEGAAVYHLSNVTELHFADTSDIVASQAGTGVTSAQITELYGAAFGRLPDVGGLGYYEQAAAANPSMPLLQFAEFFLASPEYTNNPAHSYALTTVGDTQFINDSYQNLLGRAPASGDAAWYEANVINPIIQADTTAGKTMAQAEFHARAQVLVYFSASPEFTNDVSTTGTGTPAFGGHHWLQLI